MRRRDGPARPPRMRTLSERQFRSVLLVLGAGHIALGLWQVISPGTFFRTFAAFGPKNDHYIRDVATLYLALGVMLLAATSRPSWRAPVLLLAVLQYGFHVVNHMIDVTDADPGWIGPADVVALALVEAVLILVLGTARRSRE